MKKQWHLFFISVLLITSSAFGSDFETDSWLGEGFPSFSVKNSPLNLYSNPTVTSGQIQYSLQKGTRIVFDKSKLRMKRSLRQTEKAQGSDNQGPTVYFDETKVITKQSVTLTAKAEVNDVHCKNSTGKKKMVMPDGTERIVKRGDVIIAPGETIEFLQYRAEGYITVRYKDNICEVMGDVTKFSGLEKQPVVEWWIRIVDENKMPKGWLLVDSSQVNFLERGFGF